MQREQLSGQQHPEFKLEPRQRSRGADATTHAQAGQGQRPALNEKSLRLKLESGVLPSLPSSKGGKRNHNMERHQVYYLKFPLLQKLASQAASGTPQWHPSTFTDTEGQELTTCSMVVSPKWSHSLTPIRWEPALCSALRGTQSSWSHPNIGVLVHEPPRKSQKLQDLLPWPPDSSKWHYSWKPEELLGCVLRQLTFSVLKQAYGEGTIISTPR